MKNICCVGHTTLDKIITQAGEKHLPGGTSFYFSNAISKLEIQSSLVTSVAKEDNDNLQALLATGIPVHVINTRKSLCFVNIYGENPDERKQRVTQKADPFFITDFNDIHADVFHLGPLLADDITVELIKQLSVKGRLSLDVQGFLREVQGEQVIPVSWLEMKEALPYIHYLKANNEELSILTGTTDIKKGLQKIASLGVKEVIATLGSKGSVILVENKIFEIPAYSPKTVVDVTGCGDTYMAAYLTMRLKGLSVADAGKFASGMAGLKTEQIGPFRKNVEDVVEFIRE